MGGQRSWRSGLDSNLRHRYPCMGLEEFKQTCLGFPLWHHSVGYVRRLFDIADLSRGKVAESDTWRVWGLRLVKSFEVPFGI